MNELKTPSLPFAPTSLQVFVFQLIGFVALVSLAVTGSAREWLLCGIVYFFMEVLGGTITFHRLLSHRSFTPKRWFAYAGPLFGTLIGAGSPISWAAIHRQHHRHSDTEKDPHSPDHQRWYQVQWGSMFHRPSFRYVPDLMRSRYQLALHRYYWLIHLAYAASLAVFGWRYVVCCYLAPASLTWNIASSVNLLNHYRWFGYRNFETRDKSVNNLLTGLLAGGEGFHNNHHARPSDYLFSKNWWEFDLSGFLIGNFLRTK